MTARYNSAIAMIACMALVMTACTDRPSASVPAVANETAIAEEAEKAESEDRLSNRAVRSGCFPRSLPHGRDISSTIKQSAVINLVKDGSISGQANGKWKMTGGSFVDLTIDGVEYKGVFLCQWDEGTLKRVMTFTALSKNGTAVFGSQVAKSDQE